LLSRLPWKAALKAVPISAKNSLQMQRTFGRCQKYLSAFAESLTKTGDEYTPAFG
jgi:hypothetical protein